MTRVQADNPVWILCCCGGLPFIAVVKGLLCCIPFALFFTLAVAGTSLFWLPHDVIHTYNTALHVSHVGPNLRVLTLLLLPVPLLLWPPFITLCTLILTVLTGLFLPAAFTFDDSSALLTGGFHDAFSIGWEKLLQFWEWNRKAVFGFLKDLRDRPLREGEEPFDVSLAQLATSLAMAALGLLVVGLLGGIVCTVYTLPCTLKSFQHLWRFYREAWGKSQSREEILWMLIVFPLWLLANAVLPFLCLLAYAIGIVVCAGFGIGAAFVSYQRGVAAAWRWMLQAPCDAERALLAFLEIRSVVRIATGRAGKKTVPATDQWGNERYAIFVLRCIEPRYSREDARIADQARAGAGVTLVTEEEVKRSVEHDWSGRAADDASSAQEAEAEAPSQHKKKKKHRPGH